MNAGPGDGSGGTVLLGANGLWESDLLTGIWFLCQRTGNQVQKITAKTANNEIGSSTLVLFPSKTSRNGA